MSFLMQDGQDRRAIITVHAKTFTHPFEKIEMSRAGISGTKLLAVGAAPATLPERLA